MLQTKEDSRKITYNEKEYVEEQYVGNSSEGGIFMILGIYRNHVEEDDKEAIYGGYEVGQELDPQFHCKKLYVGSSFSELKKPKECLINADQLISAEGILRNRMGVLDEQKSNVEDILAKVIG